MIAAVLLAAAVPAPLTCGAVTRPGVAELGEDGIWRGRAIDLCRAVAAQTRGSHAEIAFHSYDSVAGLRAAVNDSIAFVSAAERATPPLALTLRAGPEMAVDRQVLVVPTASPVRKAADLAGRMICFIVGTPAEDALDDWAARTHVPIERLAFQEPIEMEDAFGVGKCSAEAIDLRDAPVGQATRTLDDPLASASIMAATPAARSADWARTVSAISTRWRLRASGS